MDKNTKGQVSIIACAVLWSTSGLFIKILQWHPMVIAGLRSLIAALFMLGIKYAARRRVSYGKVKYRYVWGAALAYSATMILFVTANKMTTSANAILLQYSAPIWAAILGWVLAKEKPRGEHWAALAAVAAGMLLFFKDGIGSGSLLGDGIAVLSGVAFGAYSVFMRLQKEGNPADSMILSHVITALAGLPFFFIFTPSFTFASTGAILFMGIFQIGMASVLFSYGIRRITAVQAMLTAIIEPLLNPVWVLVVTGEKPGASALTGGGIIITAVIASSLAGKRRERLEQASEE